LVAVELLVAAVLVVLEPEVLVVVLVEAQTLVQHFLVLMDLVSVEQLESVAALLMLDDFVLEDYFFLLHLKSLKLKVD
jgi:hypothetical protein